MFRATSIRFQLMARRSIFVCIASLMEALPSVAGAARCFSAARWLPGVPSRLLELDSRLRNLPMPEMATVAFI